MSHVAERCARLTAREKEILRLVSRLGASKAIARELGIEPDSVDRAITRVLSKLQVSNRHTAAQMLASLEADELSRNQDAVRENPTLSGSCPVEPDETAAIIAPSPHQGRMAQELREERALYTAERQQLPTRRPSSLKSFLLFDGGWDDLIGWRRVARTLDLGFRYVLAVALLTLCLSAVEVAARQLHWIK